MLTWDDEVTPTPSNSSSSGSIANREAAYTPLVPQAPQIPIPHTQLRTFDDVALAPVAPATSPSAAAAIAPIVVQPAAARPTAQAAQRLDACLGRELGPDNPFLLGSLHRDRAYVAALSGDAPTFEHHFRAMARHFEATDNPPLLAQCTRLLADAVRLGVRTPPSGEGRCTDLDADTSVERPAAAETASEDHSRSAELSLQTRAPLRS